MHAGHGIIVTAEDSPEVLGVLDFDIGLPAVGTCFMFHHTPERVGGYEGSPAEFGDADPVGVGVVEVFVTSLWVTHWSASWQLFRQWPSRLPYFVP